jgi:bile acid-coenzyme A ligase
MLLGDVPRRNAGRLGPDRWAVRHGEDVLDWGTLADRAARRANALAAQDVGQDDFVVLALHNGNALYELTFALWILGATPTLVSPRLPRAELEGIVALASPRALIASDPDLAAAMGGLTADFGRDHPDATERPSLEARHWKAMTSGGSTGRPKLIVDHLPSRMEMGDGPSPLMLPRDGVILNPAPLYHNFPFALSHSAMVLGASVVSMERFDAAEMLALIDRHRVQWVNLVPTMMQRVARLPEEERARHDLSALETVWHTAAPVAPALKRFWIDWLGGDRIWEMYGGSEGYCTTLLNGTEWLAHPGSVGRCLGGEVRITGEDGAALPPGEVGEIFMRPHGAERRSYHYVGADSRRTDDGFESLGDFGWLDAEGYVYIADRRTDMILSGGRNVFPAEIESVLMEHPGVDVAVVIGLPDEDLGAVPHAIVRAEPGRTLPDADALRAFAAERLVGYKLPRSYEFTDAPLRDEAGKVRRSQLRAERTSETTG